MISLGNFWRKSVTETLTLCLDATSWESFKRAIITQKLNKLLIKFVYKVLRVSPLSLISSCTEGHTPSEPTSSLQWELTVQTSQCLSMLDTRLLWRQCSTASPQKMLFSFLVLLILNPNWISHIFLCWLMTLFLNLVICRSVKRPRKSQTLCHNARHHSWVICSMLKKQTACVTPAYLFGHIRPDGLQGLTH